MIFTPKADKQFSKLDRHLQKRLLVFIDKLETSHNPRLQGKHLKGPYDAYWRYHIGEYRLLCVIEERIMRIVAVKVAHRRHVYNEIP